MAATCIVNGSKNGGLFLIFLFYLTQDVLWKQSLFVILWFHLFCEAHYGARTFDHLHALDGIEISILEGEREIHGQVDF